MTYDHAMPLVESFVSIQGEGPFMGHPAYFIRVKQCNLYKKCPVGCDTYNKVKQMVETYAPYDQIYNVAMRYGHLVITGGEPTLYNDKILKLLDHFVNDDIIIEVETNGYRLPQLVSKSPVKLHVNFSPKSYHLEDVVPIVEAILEHNHNAVLKVVTWDNKQVINFVEKLAKSAYYNLVWLMPRGASAIELESSWPITLDLALTHKLKVSSRLHIYSNTL